MSRPGQRNNVLAGLFLVAGVVLAVAMSFVLSDARERLTPMTDYVIRFAMSDGTVGLKPGSSVLLGGQPVGRVTSVTLPIGDSKERASIDIGVAIRSDVILYDDAQVYLEKPLLGTLTSINIASMGSGTDPSKTRGASSRLEEGETIAGGLAPPSFLAQAGLGPEEVSRVKDIVQRAQDTVKKVDSIVGKATPDVDAVIADMRAAAAGIRDAVQTITQRVPAWSERIDSTTASVQTAANDVQSATKGLPALRDEASGLITDARSMISENRPAVSRIVDNADEAAQRFAEQAGPIAKDARETLQKASALADRLDTLVATEEPNIRRVLANARLASDQLKLTMIEVRAQPWRLLLRPDTKELETELLYDSARSYAAAVSDLRAASASLQALVSSPDKPQPASGDLAALSKQLDEAISRFKNAEDAFMQRLIQKSQP